MTCCRHIGMPCECHDVLFIHSHVIHLRDSIKSDLMTAAVGNTGSFTILFQVLVELVGMLDLFSHHKKSRKG